MRQTDKISKSIGAGLASLAGGRGRTYFVLQHRTATQRHQAGKNQEIIVDYAEMGRNPKCTVRFGEDCPSVSGIHAAIIREGNDWIIRHLSKSNQTLVNGRPVSTQWFLKHGDEIELSNGGPKLGFLVPNNPAVSSIPLSRRLSLFRQQALRPYRNALAALTAILLVSMAAMGYFLYGANQQIGDLMTQNMTISEAQQIQAARADSLERANEQNQQVQQQLQQQVAGLRRQLRDLPRATAPTNPGGTGSGSVTPPEGNGPSLEPLLEHVYFIYAKRVVYTIGNETSELEDFNWSGTGFLLSDGRFVTARHVIEPWYFLNSESSDAEKILNMIANNGGRVDVEFAAFSKSGQRLTFKNTAFTVNRSNDEPVEWEGPDGQTYVLKIAGVEGGGDWAHYRPGGGGLAYSGPASNALPQQTKLYVLGFPLGYGADSPSEINPIYSTTEVGTAGLNRGVILTTDRNFDHGNSGGPVFMLTSTGYSVVGIVSAGIGDALGVIVPIANIN